MARAACRLGSSAARRAEFSSDQRVVANAASPEEESEFLTGDEALKPLSSVEAVDLPGSVPWTLTTSEHSKHRLESHVGPGWRSLAFFSLGGRLGPDQVCWRVSSDCPTDGVIGIDGVPIDFAQLGQGRVPSGFFRSEAS